MRTGCLESSGSIVVNGEVVGTRAHNQAVNVEGLAIAANGQV